MSEAIIAQKGPFPVEVEAGKKYLWCACGRSNNQPFCDLESHKAVGMKPVHYTPEESATVFFCGCKQSSNAPRCDGTHGKL